METKNRRQKNIHARAKRPSLVRRSSLSKSIGQLHKSQREEESPLIAVQKVHLFRKQKAFLAKQAEVFEKKSKTLRRQVKELEGKIKNQKELAVSIVKNLEADKADEIETKVETIENKRVPRGRSKPDKTFGQKAKNFFKLDY